MASRWPERYPKVLAEAGERKLKASTLLMLRVATRDPARAQKEEETPSPLEKRQCFCGACIRVPMCAQWGPATEAPKEVLLKLPRLSAGPAPLIPSRRLSLKSQVPRLPRVRSELLIRRSPVGRRSPSGNRAEIGRTEVAGRAGAGAKGQRQPSLAPAAAAQKPAAARTGEREAPDVQQEDQVAPPPRAMPSPGVAMPPSSLPSPQVSSPELGRTRSDASMSNSYATFVATTRGKNCQSPESLQAAETFETFGTFSSAGQSQAKPSWYRSPEKSQVSSVSSLQESYMISSGEWEPYFSDLSDDGEEEEEAEGDERDERDEKDPGHRPLAEEVQEVTVRGVWKRPHPGPAAAKPSPSPKPSRRLDVKAQRRRHMVRAYG
ncbi:unnamed protein product [Effrenium voratum]|uniref:Uncharacterized protein n=1 Tax=Effrenium voratum TaxID=2562239 RepID=A0AA36IMR6_9DINO|nr:unnamed protein product [Effrenium voratum]